MSCEKAGRELWWILRPLWWTSPHRQIVHRLSIVLCSQYAPPLSDDPAAIDTRIRFHDCAEPVDFSTLIMKCWASRWARFLCARTEHETTAPSNGAMRLLNALAQYVVRRTAQHVFFVNVSDSELGVLSREIKLQISSKKERKKKKNSKWNPLNTGNNLLLRSGD